MVAIEYTSAGGPTGCPSAPSGEMYLAVPKMSPACVAIPRSAQSSRAMPKSSTFT